ncbi:MAG: 4,5-DOPA dioxygenase extradiol [Gammaproteobacteria bacterium]|nr:4,5-DOPA dioxygenase extradiol [Gammaproteobacteria bacterium]
MPDTPARLPALFLGHGNPLNALQSNAWTRSWAALGATLPRPRAVLAVSAHWYIGATAVTAMAQPRTIHDFGGFPQELFAVRYPARGDPALAARVQSLLAPLPVQADHDWGLDHGTWSVLCHVFPAADVPVVQLSIDETQPPAFHYELGARLRPLREEGVLLLGSGDIVHNLHAYAWGRHPQAPYDWALRFEERVRGALSSGEHAPLIDYPALGRDALLAVPTPEHYLPLLYVLGAGLPGESVSFPVEGMDGGSVSMLAVQLGA